MTPPRTAAALIALTITLTACTPTAPEPPPATPTSPTLVHMSTRQPDPWDITILDGWEVVHRNEFGLSVTHLLEGKSEAARAAGFFIKRRRGDSVYERMNKGSTPGYPIEPQDLFHHEHQRLLFRETVDITVLPERLIGGEKAFGFSSVDITEARHALQETWFVVRHDGMWQFTLQPAHWEETIPPEIYQMLDSFHWITPEPSPTTSQS
ncbi:MAG: hypothetical protein Q4D89_06340 [Arachnia propionica]|nr:hypothetical protein [Arachnia propionica]